jgi:hypothetical protein
MRLPFDMPGYTKIEGDTLYTHDLEVAVEIEPDESKGDADWYIARCFVEHKARRGMAWEKLSPSHPLFEAIRDHAMDFHGHKLSELWEEYLFDKPLLRPRTDREEHATHGGVL